jgi:hypothetical protein
MEDPELSNRLAIIDKLDQWLHALPNLRFIDPRTTTVSYRWLNRLISLKWNANEEKPTELQMVSYLFRKINQITPGIMLEPFLVLLIKLTVSIILFHVLFFTE